MNNRRVFTFHYQLKDIQGQLLDSSHEGPLSFLEGAHQILPHLEKQIISLDIGDKKIVKLTAEESYGVPNPQMMLDVPKKELAHLQYDVGTFIQLELGQQLKLVRVAKVTDEIVTLDGNHPLAGLDLEFDIEMVNIRPATEDEVTHGHAHGVGGHQH